MFLCGNNKYHNREIMSILPSNPSWKQNLEYHKLMTVYIYNICKIYYLTWSTLKIEDVANSLMHIEEE